MFRCYCMRETSCGSHCFSTRLIFFPRPDLCVCAHSHHLTSSPSFFSSPQRRFFRIGETANGLLQLLYSKTAESSIGAGVRGTIALTCVQVMMLL
jgi:hypothetical protein